MYVQNPVPLVTGQVLYVSLKGNTIASVKDLPLMFEPAAEYYYILPTTIVNEDNVGMPVNTADNIGNLIINVDMLNNGVQAGERGSVIRCEEFRLLVPRMKTGVPKEVAEHFQPLERDHHFPDFINQDGPVEFTTRKSCEEMLLCLLNLSQFYQKQVCVCVVCV